MFLTPHPTTSLINHLINLINCSIHLVNHLINNLINLINLIIDQSAAYDLLDHHMFPKKLREYDFDEASIEWIQDSVKIESKTSDPCEESATLQG